MQDKKVSIILPVLKGTRYLGQSIKSCLEQTHKNIELVIIDDFCTEGQVLRTVRSFKDKRIKYYRNRKSMGLSRCLNKGLEKSGGDYITGTADDSFFGKTAIENMLSFLIKKNEKCVYTSFYCFKNDDPEKKSLVRLYDTSLMARHCFACFLFDREVTDQTGLFDNDISFTQYYDYWLRVSKKFKIAFLESPLYYLRLHPDSLLPTDINNFKYSIELIIVKYKNNILDKNKAAESLVEAGIKYVAENVKGSFLLDFSLKNPLLYKPYLRQKIEELVFEKKPAGRSFGRLKKEVVKLFEEIDRKVQEFKTGGISARRKIVVDLMKYLLERNLSGIYAEFKYLIHENLEMDFSLLSNINCLEFNYRFGKSEISESSFLKAADLPIGSFIDPEIKKEFYLNLIRFKEKKAPEYYFCKLNEEFDNSSLYRNPEDILSFINFLDDFKTKKYLYEKALSLASDNNAVTFIQKKIQELYIDSLKK